MSLLSRLIPRLGRGDQPPAAPPDPEGEARAEAQEAVARLDLPGALAILQPWEQVARQPATLALLGHVLKTLGDPERARTLLEGALRTHPNDLLLLETLAQLYDLMRDPIAEFRCRKQRMMQPDCQVVHILDAMRALVQIRGPKGGPPAGDVRLVRAMFAQREPFAQPAECMRFAELSFSVGDAPEPAIQLMKRYAPPAAGTRDRLFTRTAARDVPAEAGEWRATGAQGEAVELLSLKDAWVLPGLHWSPCLPGTERVFDAFMTMRPRPFRETTRSPLLLRGRRQMLLRLPEAQPQTVEGPCVLVGGDGTSNYYHFLHEHLSRLGVLDALGVDTAGMRFVVGANMQPFQLEFFALLGIGPERLVVLPEEGALAFGELLAPLPLGRGGEHTHPLIARWARERVVPAAGAPAGGNRKLFLSRARTGRRRIVNEAEIFEVFAAHGYEMAYPEELSVAEQVRLFAQATHIAGSGGAALTNMLFMPPGGRVLMLNNRYIPGHARTMYFGPLTQACGHRFTILSGEPVAFPTDRAIDADVRIDVAAARALLEEA